MAPRNQASGRREAPGTNGACLPSGSRPETALRSDPGATTTVTRGGIGGDATFWPAQGVPFVCQALTFPQVRAWQPDIRCGWETLWAGLPESTGGKKIRASEGRDRTSGWLAERNWLLAEYYASAIYSCCARSACADVPSRPRGAGALSSPARCRGVVKLDRRQSEARSGNSSKAWEAARLSTAMPRRGQYSRAADTRLPDDAGGFRVCGEVVT